MAISTSWIQLDHVENINEGVTAFRKKRRKIAVLKKDGDIIKVFSDSCPHNRRIKLSDGYIIGGDDEVTITCQFHGACFRVKDGEILRGPGRDDLELYKFRINEDKYLEFQIDE